MMVEVLGVPCQVLQDRVPATIAHPDEEFHTDTCDLCKMVAHPVTGSAVLVWGFKTGDYTVSRYDPNFPAVRDEWPQ